ncbi:hypothetical protein M3M39_02355 [Fructilactobacillus hinvesii]|uniref:DNA-entry nuclease n=1 Tax=Fructilactobacillus hinvesii TaxID=2940300 RepID=A0ABY5BUK2_9LACO|nr:hypothetical protein [Fructilactobacillus hinvesii]USS88340.1 hypothetical protein M3M39_02355 [Fructilactobacillus hinvesii]
MLIIRAVHLSFKFLAWLVLIAIISLAGNFLPTAQAASHSKKARQAQSQTRRSHQKHQHQKKHQHKTADTATDPADTVTTDQSHGDQQASTANNEAIIGNSRTMVYHTPDQSNYHINSGNIVSFHSEAEAQAAGYHKAAR